VYSCSGCGIFYLFFCFFIFFFLGFQISATYNREIHVNVLLVYLQEYDKSNDCQKLIGLEDGVEKQLALSSGHLHLFFFNWGAMLQHAAKPTS